MRPTLDSKPITSLKPDPNQPRKQFNDDELRLLGESLKVKQIHPLLVRPDGTIIDGERRWRAAMKAGINALDVIVTEEQLTPSQIAEIQIISAMHREGLTGYEQWQAIERLVELNPGWHGKDIARALQIDPSMIVRLRSPGKCIKVVQEAFAAGLIGVSDVYAMSKGNEQQQHELLAAKLNGASRNDIEHAARKSRSGNTPAVRLSRAKLLLPSGISITVAGSDLALDDLIEALSEAQKGAKRARESGLNIKTMAAVFRDQAKAGG